MAFNRESRSRSRDRGDSQSMAQGAFFQGANIDLRYSNVNSVVGDQYNDNRNSNPTVHYHNNLGYRAPNPSPWLGGGAPSFTPGHVDPPSWVAGNTQSPSGTEHNGTPSLFQTSTPLRHNASEPPHKLSADTSWEGLQQAVPKADAPNHSHSESSSTTDPYSTAPSASFIHTATLPSFTCLLDDALVNSIHSSKNPDEWIRQDSNHICTIAQDLASLTGNTIDFSQISPVYSRLSLYILSHLMFCTGNERLFHEYKEKLREWIFWDNLTIIRNHLAVRKYLENIFKQISQSEQLTAFHPTDTLRLLLTLDVITLSARLAVVVTAEEEIRNLVALRDDEAQNVLDLIQARLDYPIDTNYKRHHLKALMKLSKASELYPKCMVLNGVKLEGNCAVAGGGFGEVWKARFNNRLIAVKMLRIFKRRDAVKILKDFSSEAILWRQLSHPNILPFYGVFHFEEGSSRLCLASPWLENGDLIEYLSENEDPHCLLFVLDIAQGLEYLHGLSPSIFHGDIKGVNVLVTTSKRACLADFGLSTAGESRTMSKMSIKGTGTGRWKAPELLRPVPQDVRKIPTISQATDMYSFACTCYEIFSGEVPFYEYEQDESIPFYIIEGRRPKRPTSVTSRRRGLNDAIWSIVESCWSPEPELRPSASQVVASIRAMKDRPNDERLLNDFDDDIVSQIREDDDDPFSLLAFNVDDSSEMENLKWNSRSTY